jgi:hypothetical protein
MASELRQSRASCGSSINLTGFDIAVHVKSVCEPALKFRHVRHIHDLVDSWYNGGAASPWNREGAVDFHAEIFNTPAHAVATCSANALCVVIPHPFNTRCPTRSPSSALKRLGKGAITVGFLGCAPPPPRDLVDSVRSFPGIHAVHMEPCRRPLRLCSFYDSLDVAIVWQNRNVSTMEQLKYKPGTRYQNAVMLGLPTIANGEYDAYRALGPDELLCTSMQCLRKTLHSLRLGKSNHSSGSLHSNIVKALSFQQTCTREIVEAELSQYLELFDRVLALDAPEVA